MAIKNDRHHFRFPQLHRPNRKQFSFRLCNNGLFHSTTFKNAARARHTQTNQRLERRCHRLRALQIEQLTRRLR